MGRTKKLLRKLESGGRSGPEWAIRAKVYRNLVLTRAARARLQREIERCLPALPLVPVADPGACKMTREEMASQLLHVLIVAVEHAADRLEDQPMFIEFDEEGSP